MLEPTFEADYRPVRGAVDAVKEVHRLICRGHTDVVDADLSRYFDSIPHDELLKSVARRIVNAPLVRVDERVPLDLEAYRVESIPDFRKFGATRVRGDGRLPLPAGAAIVAEIATTGWHIMTVDDAHRILAGRQASRPEGGFLSNRNGWTSDVQDKADRMKIVGSLFPICERIVATRVAAMVI